MSEFFFFKVKNVSLQAKACKMDRLYNRDESFAISEECRPLFVTQLTI